MGKQEKKKEMKWSSNTIYVDVESGEIVPVGDIKRLKKEYRILESQKSVKVDDNNGIITYTKLVRKIEKQLEIF